ncbi:alpha/beta hydrolase-fold protein [Phycicoccus sp. SLBN-51]|uniref:alpha/beta hydrolase n=1 Tax=Phycicoccus sp. SLBN-51 TaxID=2768447 RepID=UPI00115430F2|nr:alpha/beta hydrolase-fold protein [Phycicoccus sp. SLBN-51]TQJ49218.1 S-formylglutathione hydrolase FrmB [Phycicoccus sp. SLBN-51]
MSLLGWPLVAVLATLTTAAVVSAMMLWTRVRGAPALRLAQRLGLLLGTQVTALLLVAAVVNDYGYFYGSWAELLGKDSKPTVVTVGGSGDASGASGPSTSALHVAGLHFAFKGHGIPKAVRAETIGDSARLAAAWAPPSQWASRGRLEAVTVQGARSGLSTPALVWLPPQYFQPAYRHTLFPAAEVLSGYPGTTTALVFRLHYPNVLLREIDAHRAKPTVLVMLRPTVAPPRDTECTNVPGGPQTLTYLTQDVPSAVEQLARVRPTGWAAIGASTGGYCATKMALTRSDLFPAAVSFSGYYHALRDGTTGDLWGGSPVLRNLNNPEWLVTHQTVPPVSLMMTIGTAERGPSGVADTRRFAALVHAPMTAHVIYVPGGGHNFGSWGYLVPGALDWVTNHLAGA